MADPSETTLASHAPAGAEASELLGAVRALSAQVGGLQAELQELRADTRALPPSGAEAHGWQSDAPARRDGSPWMRSIASPATRRPPVPRLFLEIAFLVAVACLAAVARLDTWLVITIMGAAWALVALAEWASAREGRLRTEAAFGRYGGSEGAWFATPAREALEVGAAGDEPGTRLPPPPPSE